MSGHSKWSTIKHKKGITDQKRADVFSKLARLITATARHGGGDLEINYSLRSAVEKARSQNMPKDNIERAIKKGTGETEGVLQLEELLMEAYGPGGAALLVEAVTDNRNRTTSEIRHIISKNGGKPASEGSVKWLFEHKISLMLPLDATGDQDEFELAAIDAGAEDIIWGADSVTVYVVPQNLQKALAGLREKGYPQAETSLDWVAKDEIELSPEDTKKLERLFETLNEQDDVQEIYTNAR